MAVPLPPLNLSNAGPSVSDGRATSGAGGVGTGDFLFKPKGSLLQSVLPLAALLGVVWLVTRKG